MYLLASAEATKVLSDWGISLDDAYMILQGRNIPPIDIIFGGGVTVPGSREANWSGASNKNKAISVVSIYLIPLNIIYCYLLALNKN